MPALRYLGIPQDLAREIRATMRSPQYGHPAHREPARGYGPCRVCLKTFAIGVEDRILVTFQPFTDPGSLPAPGPIFIHAEPCERYDAPEFPPDFRALPLVLEGYRKGGRLLAQERPVDAPLELAVRRLFHERGADYVHIRNGEAGCFMARVEPAAGQ